VPIRQISFSDLSNADLILDAVYKGGLADNAGDDRIAKLLPCGNQGGFRFCGSTTLPGRLLAVPFSTFNEPTGQTCLSPSPDVSCTLATIDNPAMNYTKRAAEITCFACVLRPCTQGLNHD
jgi:hypothetical protein